MSGTGILIMRLPKKGEVGKPVHDQSSVFYKTTLFSK